MSAEKPAASVRELYCITSRNVGDSGHVENFYLAEPGDIEWIEKRMHENGRDYVVSDDMKGIDMMRQDYISADGQFLEPALTTVSPNGKVQRTRFHYDHEDLRSRTTTFQTPDKVGSSVTGQPIGTIRKITDALIPRRN